jgi:hypothetical protein
MMSALGALQFGYPIIILPLLFPVPAGCTPIIRSADFLAGLENRLMSQMCGVPPGLPERDPSAKLHVLVHVLSYCTQVSAGCGPGDALNHVNLV